MHAIKKVEGPIILLRNNEASLGECARAMGSLVMQTLISDRWNQAWSVAARDSTAKGEPWQMDFCSCLFFLDPQLSSFQDAAAQCCPVGLPGLRFVGDWRSWKAEEGDIFEGEEERCKVGTGGEKLPGGRQACLPQGYQDKILKHAGSVSCLLQR